MPASCNLPARSPSPADLVLGGLEAGKEYDVTKAHVERDVYYNETEKDATKEGLRADAAGNVTVKLLGGEDEVTVSKKPWRSLIA